MQYKIIEKESFRVVGEKKHFSCGNGEHLVGIPKMWEEVFKEGTVGRLAELNDGQIKGILGVCVHDSEPNSVDYWVATAIEDVDYEGMDSLIIPGSTWAVFEVHGPMPDAMQNAWKKIVSEWFPSSGYMHAGTPDLEVYLEEDSSRSDFYSEIWIPIQK